MCSCLPLLLAGLASALAYDECVPSFDAAADYFPARGRCALPQHLLLCLSLCVPSDEPRHIRSRDLVGVADGEYGIQSADLFSITHYKSFKV
jgi:hypothetical protein